MFFLAKEAFHWLVETPWCGDAERRSEHSRAERGNEKSKACTPRSIDNSTVLDSGRRNDGCERLDLGWRFVFQVAFDFEDRVKGAGEIGGLEGDVDCVVG